MANLAKVAGVLVGFERREYQAFTDQETKELRPGGETLWVYVAAPDGQDAPTAVRLAGPEATAHFRSLQEAGFGGQVSLTVEHRARNNRIVAYLQKIDKAEAVKG